MAGSGEAQGPAEPDAPPSPKVRDFAAEQQTDVLPAAGQKGSAFVTSPEAYHPAGQARHDDHISRLFIGPHLVVTSTAPLQRQGTIHNLLGRRRAATKLWRHALRSGSEGSKKKPEELEHIEWRGGSFLVGADVRAAFVEAKELDRQEQAASESGSTHGKRRRRRSRSVSVQSPDDMLRLLSLGKSSSHSPEGPPSEASSSAALLSPGLSNGGANQPDVGHELACRPSPDEEQASPMHITKSARFHDEPESIKGHAGDQEPASPSEVLARIDSSTAKLKRAPDTPAKELAFRSDRMLLKQGWSPRQSLPHPFDALQQRQYPVAYREWEEHLVEYKAARIEVWGRSHGAGPHRIQGRLKLRHVIPMRKGKVNLSIYNHSEPAFCITIQHSLLTAAAARRRLNKHAVSDHFKAEGTAVFLFRPMTPSLLNDWIFDLWTELGNELPPRLTVTVPELSSRLLIPVPEEVSHAPKEWHGSGVTTGAGYKVLTPTKVVENCINLIDGIGDWQHLMDERGSDDVEMLLAWRRGDIVDWVLDEHMIAGGRRDAAVIAGYAYQQSRRVQVGGLELRTAVHYPDSCKLGNGQRMSEPPSLEGFLLRTDGLRRERFYISTQSGHLFVNETKDAHPPEPPVPPEALKQMSVKERLRLLGAAYGELIHPDAEEALRDTFGKRVKRAFGKEPETLPTIELDDFDSDDLSYLRQESMQRFVEFEKRRVCALAASAKGYCDLRHIKAVRKVAEADGQAAPPISEQDDLVGQGSKAARSFELELANGKIVRFETRSEVDVQEWVDGLESLIVYWRARQRADAVEQMAALPQNILKSRSPFRNEAIGDAPPRDPLDFEPDPLAYSRLFDFCSIRGCRGILRIGRLYVTKGKRHRSKERWFALVRGQLLSFKIEQHKRISGANVPDDFHERTTTYSLKGCYLVTGHVCIRESKTRERPYEGSREGRLYGDHLVSYDEESECVFELWYGSDSKSACSSASSRAAHSSRSVGSHGKTAHFRARSKLDRDAWAACIGRELERLHREGSR